MKASRSTGIGFFGHRAVKYPISSIFLAKAFFLVLRYTPSTTTGRTYNAAIASLHAHLATGPDIDPTLATVLGPLDPVVSTRLPVLTAHHPVRLVDP